MAIDATSPRSRRAILGGLLGGAAAVVAGAVSRVAPAQAATNDPVLAGNGVDADAATVVTSSSPQGLVGRTSAAGAVDGKAPAGVVGIASNAAGYNFADAPSGVLGIASSGTGFNMGVMGIVSANDGIGVAGRATNNNGGATGVYGASEGQYGRGVRGSGKAAGVSGQGNGPTAKGVEGIGLDGTGVSGLGAIAGIHGSVNGPSGRGGVFEGGVAQVRLVPSGLTIHPTTGARGDLFLDKSGRLWFCKGGTNWKKLA